MWLLCRPTLCRLLLYDVGDRYGLSSSVPSLKSLVGMPVQTDKPNRGWQKLAVLSIVIAGCTTPLGRHRAHADLRTPGTHPQLHGLHSPSQLKVCPRGDSFCASWMQTEAFPLKKASNHFERCSSIRFKCAECKDDRASSPARIAADGVLQEFDW